LCVLVVCPEQLHSTAAYFPEKPTPEQQLKAKGLVDGLAAFYPCSYCAKDFRRCIAKHPPR
jgi:mitochondrial FAD-linked sulfhydryl oxidase